MCDVVRQNQHNTAKQLSSNKKKSLLLANGPFLFLQNVSPQSLDPLLQLLFLSLTLCLPLGRTHVMTTGTPRTSPHLKILNLTTSTKSLCHVR